MQTFVQHFVLRSPLLMHLVFILIPLILMDSFSTHVDVISTSCRCCAVMKYWLLDTLKCYHISFDYVNFFISCHNKILPGTC